ncbi:carbohydrate ABC transporter permease [Saccharopolyspora taberi]|uniref:carbohydrate ABC transporter permease n=1 Tax=Saccharopolyspora taberi TaxID=60895 RepID=UPI0031D4214D
MASRRDRAGARLRHVLRYLITGVLALVYASPVLYMVLGSLEPSENVLSGLRAFTPNTLTTANYPHLTARFHSADTGYFWGFFAVSVVVATTVVVGGLAINSLAGYALARLRWAGRDAVLTVIVALAVVPFEALAVPLFFLLAGLRDTIAVQALPFLGNAFTIYLFQSFFRSLPTEIEEAAKLDGAGPLRIFFLIIVPMSKPVFASAAILTFLTQWTSFLWPVLMISDPTVRPLPLAISVFQGNPPYDWGAIMAFGVVMVAPVLIVFLLFQRWFVRSIADSAIQG